MSMTRIGLAALRAIDPETAHGLAIRALAAGLTPPLPKPDAVLATTVAGLSLPSPIGLAAGMDKNAEAISGLARLGFGFVECGSVTPRPQPGNPKPRLFRLTEDKAVINRMGFNNDGLEAFAARLERRPKGVVVGANLGANKETEDKAADYVTGLTRLAGLADYFTVNVSSPNTPGLRALQGRAALDDLLGRVAEARGGPQPVFLKIAPDLDEAEIGDIVEAAVAHGLSGLIVSNTTLDRPSTLRSAFASQAGGLSGAPLAPKALKALELTHQASNGKLTLIAAGGIGSGEEAYRRIRAGASAVQVYSALVYEGPGLIDRIGRDLAARLKADGFTTVTQAVAAR